MWRTRRTSAAVTSRGGVNTSEAPAPVRGRQAHASPAMMRTTRSRARRWSLQPKEIVQDRKGAAPAKPVRRSRGVRARDFSKDRIRLSFEVCPESPAAPSRAGRAETMHPPSAHLWCEPEGFAVFSTGKKQTFASSGVAWRRRCEARATSSDPESDCRSTGRRTLRHRVLCRAWIVSPSTGCMRVAEKSTGDANALGRRLSVSCSSTPCRTTWRTA